MQRTVDAENGPDFLKVEGMCKAYSGVQALDGVSLSIQRGEVHGLVGENGSGKSTLIKIITGVLASDRGRLVINGSEPVRYNPLTAIRLGIQAIYQDFSLFPNLSVAENIAITTEIAEGTTVISRARILEIANRGLARIGIELDLDAPLEEVPIFQWQLTAITRALVQNSRLIIMDEPTTALARKEVEALIEVIRKLKAAGVATLFVSHKLNEVCEVADRITVLRNGCVTTSFSSGEFDPIRIAADMIGRAPLPGQRQSHLVDSKPLLRVKNLSRGNAFSRISFELYEGEILGITGLLGSGQTQLALGLAGLSPPDSGEVFVSEQRVKLNTISNAIGSGIAYVPEDRLREGLFPEHSIGQNLLATTIDRLSPGRFLRRDVLREESGRWVKQLAIKTPSIELPAVSLSGGNQQRVVLARWLATAPRILILNNPTAGVDVGSKEGIHRLLSEFAGKGNGVILLSDDLPELLENCDRILVMGHGRVLQILGTQDLDEEVLTARIMAGALTA